MTLVVVSTSPELFSLFVFYSILKTRIKVAWKHTTHSRVKELSAGAISVGRGGRCRQNGIIHTSYVNMTFMYNVASSAVFSCFQLSLTKKFWYTIISPPSSRPPISVPVLRLFSLLLFLYFAMIFSYSLPKCVPRVRRENRIIYVWWSKEWAVESSAYAWLDSERRSKTL